MSARRVRSLKPVGEHIDTPDGDNFLVMEASADAASEFRSASANSAKWEDGKVMGFNKIGEAEVVLVGLSVYPCDKDGVVKEWKPVGAAVVRTWSDEFTKELFETVKRLSPKLVEAATVESIDKQISVLQKQREKLLKVDGEEGKPK